MKKFNILSILVGLICVAIYIRSNRDSTLTLFSSNTSPDGVYVAENFMVDGCLGECATTRIVIRKSDGRELKRIELPDTMPDMFFIWTNSKRLSIFTDATFGNSRQSIAPDKIADVDISYFTYKPMSASLATSNSKIVTEQRLSSLNVTSYFTAEPFPQMKDGVKCSIKITGSDSANFETVGVELIAVSGRSTHSLTNETRIGRVDSKFFVTNPQVEYKNLALTSADIVGVNGVGVLPTGYDHRVIRGQFLGKNGEVAMKSITKSSFKIAYNFNFTDRALIYTVPTESISKQLSDFTKCTENIDFDWENHALEAKEKQYQKNRIEHEKSLSKK